MNRRRICHQVGRMRTPWLDDRVSAGVDSVTVAPGVRRPPSSSVGVIQPIWYSSGVLYPAHNDRALFAR